MTSSLRGACRVVQIREVWQSNLHQEFQLIRDIIDTHTFVSIDTEFSGFHYQPLSRSNPHHVYESIRKNVDLLKLIQLGLTFTDADGRLPRGDDGTTCYAWQFNFREFDESADCCCPKALGILQQAGIDLGKHSRLGIDAFEFAELAMSSGIVLNPDVTYISFHGGYDFAYFLKALTCKPMPPRLSEFLGLLPMYFGVIYDVKYMVLLLCRDPFSGLSKVAINLGLTRQGTTHQAGSDSLLTADAFFKLKEVRLRSKSPVASHDNAPTDGTIIDMNALQRCQGVLYGFSL